ncbi:hypothetical protein HJFPF1_10660 [Paramyrothecium foliicola]|nr:hypothetical protein HJFPF1_10660 [Paramyrothecium foliicola]
MASLHIPQLPKTIQDAVFCTRQLGIRYLWVDALCIVQDLQEEKAREMSKMAQIFRNASITISAALTSDANEGFFYPRDVEPANLDEAVPYLPFRCSEELVGTVGLLELSGSSLRDAINRRGWTLQEQMLSRRLLIYGYLEASWQCLGTEAEKPEVLARRPPSKGWLLGLRQQLHGPGLTGAASFTDPSQWEKIVQEYSLRQITNEKDKFPALSAITAEFKPSMGHFVAGLWSSWISRLLLWRVPEPADTTRLREVAPSWSWASVDGNVAFVHDSQQLNDGETRLHGHEELIEVLECSATPKYDFAPYGELQESKLLLKGKIKPLEFDYSDAIQERTIYNPLNSWQVPYVDVYVDSAAEFRELKPPFYSMPVFRITQYIVCLLLHESAAKFRRIGLHIINYQDDHRSSDTDYTGWPYWPTAYAMIEPTVVELV